MILKGKGLFDIVTGEKVKPETGNATEWKKNDAKAQEVLLTKMQESTIGNLLSCNTSAEMWSKLKTIYDKESSVSIHLLQQKFFLIEYKNDSIASFISKLEEVASKLKQAGETISDKMIMTKVLMSLPEPYKHFRSAWESVQAEKQTLEEMTSRLLIEEERITSSEGGETTALAGMSRGTGGSGGFKCFSCGKTGHLARSCMQKNKEKNSHEGKNCFYCNKFGHKAADCWFRKNKDVEHAKKNEKNRKTPGKKNDREVYNAFIGMEHRVQGGDWCMDTGASEHMCWDRSLFETLTEKHGHSVTVGDGKEVQVKGVGTVILFAIVDQELIKTTLSNVLFVPDLKFNLFSVQ